MSQILSFWQADNRAGAWFEGRRVDAQALTADPAMAARYWTQQLRACHHNWRVQHPRG